MADSTIPKKDGIWETIKTIFWALLIAGIFRTLFFQPFWIPSGSMNSNGARGAIPRAASARASRVARRSVSS